MYRVDLSFCVDHPMVTNLAESSVSSSVAAFVTFTTAKK